MNKYEDNLIIELINKDKAINVLIPIMCKHSIEPVIQNEIILCLLNIKEDIEEVKSIFEKATSKKPVFDKPIMVLECPSCGYYLQTVVDDKGATDGAIPHYCSNCGQKINPYWSEEDD